MPPHLSAHPVALAIPPAHQLHTSPGYRFLPPRLLQLSSLTRLSALKLKGGWRVANGFAVLRQLPALRHLVLHSNTSLPDCLGQLTQIESLVRGAEVPQNTGWGMQTAAWSVR